MHCISVHLYSPIEINYNNDTEVCTNRKLGCEILF